MRTDVPSVPFAESFHVEPSAEAMWQLFVDGSAVRFPREYLLVVGRRR